MSSPVYTPRLRTGVVLCGAGTAGAYQAGVLQALTEAGVKVDVVAAHGAGAFNALAFAVDGGTRVWGSAGPWTSARLQRAYGWRPALRVAAAGLIAASLILLAPLVVLMLAAGVYVVATLAALVSLTGVSAALIQLYARVVAWLFDPPVLPTILPRLLVLALLVIGGVVIGAAVTAARAEGSRRRVRGAFWWRLLGAPLDAVEPSATLIDALWQLVRGASAEPLAPRADVGRRYVEVLADNFGQPGFREVLIAVHDVDAGRDLVGAVLAAPARTAFEALRAEAGPREAEIVDFTGPQREVVTGFLDAALRLPAVQAPTPVAFPLESYWRGERHRLCDRPELIVRLLDELAGIGVEQVIVVSPAPPPSHPRALRPVPVSGRGRIGELVRSLETAAVQDGTAAALARFSGVFVIRPDYNPIGPFDFAGVHDEGSDRDVSMAELIQQGYADGYRQFIEPSVAAGEPVEDI
jgi:hypothetical protein